MKLKSLFLALFMLVVPSLGSQSPGISAAFPQQPRQVAFRTVPIVQMDGRYSIDWATLNVTIPADANRDLVIRFVTGAQEIARIAICGNSVYFKNQTESPFTLKNIRGGVSLQIDSQAMVLGESLDCRILQLKGKVFEFSGENTIHEFLGAECDLLKLRAGAQLRAPQARLSAKTKVVNGGDMTLTRAHIETPELSNMKKFKATTLSLKVKTTRNSGDFEVDRLRFVEPGANLYHGEDGKFTNREYCFGNFNDFHMKGNSEWLGLSVISAISARFEKPSTIYCMDLQAALSLYLSKMAQFTVGKRLNFLSDQNEYLECDVHVAFDPRLSPDQKGFDPTIKQQLLGMVPGAYFSAKKDLVQGGRVKSTNSTVALKAGDKFTDLKGYTESGLLKDNSLVIQAKVANLFGDMKIHHGASVQASTVTLKGLRDGDGALALQVEESLIQLPEDLTRLRALEARAEKISLAGQVKASGGVQFVATNDLVFEPTADMGAGTLVAQGKNVTDRAGSRFKVDGTNHQKAQEKLDAQGGAHFEGGTVFLESDGSMEAGSTFRTTENTVLKTVGPLTQKSTLDVQTKNLYREGGSIEREAGAKTQTTDMNSCKTRSDQVVGGEVGGKTNVYESTEGYVTVAENLQSSERTDLRGKAGVTVARGAHVESGITIVETDGWFTRYGTMGARQHHVRSGGVFGFGGWMDSKDGYSITTGTYLNMFSSVTGENGQINSDWLTLNLFARTAARRQLEINTAFNLSFLSHVCGGKALKVNALVNASLLTMFQSNNYVFNGLVNLNEVGMINPFGVFGGNVFSVPSLDEDNFGEGLLQWGQSTAWSAGSSIAGPFGLAVRGAKLGLGIFDLSNKVSALATCDADPRDVWRPYHLVKKMGQGLELASATARTVHQAVGLYKDAASQLAWGDKKEPTGAKDSPGNDAGIVPPVQGGEAGGSEPASTDTQKSEDSKGTPQESFTFLPIFSTVASAARDALLSAAPPRVTVNCLFNHDTSLTLTGTRTVNALWNYDEGAVWGYSNDVLAGTGRSRNHEFVWNSTTSAFGDYTVGGQKDIGGNISGDVGGNLKIDGSFRAEVGGNESFRAGKTLDAADGSHSRAGGTCSMEGHGDATNRGDHGGAKGAILKSTHGKATNVGRLTSSGGVAGVDGKTTETAAASVIKGATGAFITGEEAVRAQGKIETDPDGVQVVGARKGPTDVRGLEMGKGAHVFLGGDPEDHVLPDPIPLPQNTQKEEEEGTESGEESTAESQPAPAPQTVEVSYIPLKRACGLADDSCAFTPEMVKKHWPGLTDKEAENISSELNRACRHWGGDSDDFHKRLKAADKVAHILHHHKRYKGISADDITALLTPAKETVPQSAAEETSTPSAPEPVKRPFELDLPNVVREPYQPPQNPLTFDETTQVSGAKSLSMLGAGIPVADILARSGPARNIVAESINIKTDGTHLLDSATHPAVSELNSFMFAAESVSFAPNTNYTLPGNFVALSMKDPMQIGAGTTLWGKGLLKLYGEAGFRCGHELTTTGWDTKHTRGNVKEATFSGVTLRGGGASREEGDEGRRCVILLGSNGSFEGVGTNFEALDGDGYAYFKQGYRNDGVACNYLASYRKHGHKRRYKYDTVFFSGAIESPEGRFIIMSPEGGFSHQAGRFNTRDGLIVDARDDVRFDPLYGSKGNVHIYKAGSGFLSKVGSLFHRQKSRFDETESLADFKDGAHIYLRSREGAIFVNSLLNVPNSIVVMDAKNVTLWRSVLRHVRETTGWKQNLSFNWKGAIFSNLKNILTIFKNLKKGDLKRALAGILPSLKVQIGRVTHKEKGEHLGKGSINVGLLVMPYEQGHLILLNAFNMAAGKFDHNLESMSVRGATLNTQHSYRSTGFYGRFGVGAKEGENGKTKYGLDASVGVYADYSKVHQGQQVIGQVLIGYGKVPRILDVSNGFVHYLEAEDGTIESATLKTGQNTQRSVSAGGSVGWNFFTNTPEAEVHAGASFNRRNLSEPSGLQIDKTSSGNPIRIENVDRQGAGVSGRVRVENDHVTAQPMEVNVAVNLGVGYSGNGNSSPVVSTGVRVGDHNVNMSMPVGEPLNHNNVGVGYGYKGQTIVNGPVGEVLNPNTYSELYQDVRGLLFEWGANPSPNVPFLDDTQLINSASPIPSPWEDGADSEVIGPQVSTGTVAPQPLASEMVAVDESSSATVPPGAISPADLMVSDTHSESSHGSIPPVIHEEILVASAMAHNPFVENLPTVPGGMDELMGDGVDILQFLRIDTKETPRDEPSRSAPRSSGVRERSANSEAYFGPRVQEGSTPGLPGSAEGHTYKVGPTSSFNNALEELEYPLVHNQNGRKFSYRLTNYGTRANVYFEDPLLFDPFVDFVEGVRNPKSSYVSNAARFLRDPNVEIFIYNSTALPGDGLGKITVGRGTNFAQIEVSGRFNRGNPVTFLDGLLHEGAHNYVFRQTGNNSLLPGNIGIGPGKEFRFELRDILGDWAKTVQNIRGCSVPPEVFRGLVSMPMETFAQTLMSELQRKNIILTPNQARNLAEELLTDLPKRKWNFWCSGNKELSKALIPALETAGLNWGREIYPFLTYAETYYPGSVREYAPRLENDLERLLGRNAGTGRNGLKWDSFTEIETAYMRGRTTPVPLYDARGGQFTANRHVVVNSYGFPEFVPQQSLGSRLWSGAKTAGHLGLCALPVLDYGLHVHEQWGHGYNMADSLGRAVPTTFFDAAVYAPLGLAGPAGWAAGGFLIVSNLIPEPRGIHAMDMRYYELNEGDDPCAFTPGSAFGWVHAGKAISEALHSASAFLVNKFNGANPEFVPFVSRQAENLLRGMTSFHSGSAYFESRRSRHNLPPMSEDIFSRAALPQITVPWEEQPRLQPLAIPQPIRTSPWDNPVDNPYGN